MIFGYKKNDSQYVTVVCAASKYVEFLKFKSDGYIDASDYYEDVREPDFTEIFSDDVISQFKSNVLIFEHSSEEQQDNFISHTNIFVVSPRLCIDHHELMHRIHELSGSTEHLGEMSQMFIDAFNSENTIGEIYGIEINDPWDERSYEEKMADRAHQRQADDTDFHSEKWDERKEDSESIIDKTVEERITLRDIRLSINNGSINTDKSSIRAVRSNQDKIADFKFEDDEEYNLTPEDFAIALRGDGKSFFDRSSYDTSGSEPLSNDDESNLSEGLKRFRENYKEQERKHMEYVREIKKKEVEIKQMENRDNGIFGVISLDVNISEIETPWEVIDILDGKGKDAPSNIMFKEFPFDCEIYGNIILPVSYDSKPSYVVHMNNLSRVGSIQFNNCESMVVKRIDPNIDSFILFHDELDDVYTWAKIRP